MKLPFQYKMFTFGVKPFYWRWNELNRQGIEVHGGLITWIEYCLLQELKNIITLHQVRVRQ